MNFLKKPVVTVSLIVASLALLFVFQNCSSAAWFTKAPQASVNAGGGVGSAGAGGGTQCSSTQVLVNNNCMCPGNSNFDGTNCVPCGSNQTWDSSTKTCTNDCPAGTNVSSTHTCVTCGPSQAWDGNACVSSTGTSDLPPVACSAYKAVTSPFVIPARDGSGTCYYIKLSDAVPRKSSSKFTKRETSVWSRDHTGPTTVPSHPLIIGSSAGSAGAVSDIQFAVLGTRQVVFSGNTAGTQDISVDNYILTRVTVNGVTALFAEGSADSPTFTDSTIPNDTGYIVANQTNVVNFVTGAAGRTSNFTPLDFGASLPLSTLIDFKTEALDCGSDGGVSDIYMVFK